MNQTINKTINKTHSVKALLDFKLSKTQQLTKPDWANCKSVSIKRDDLIHPVISGNKARKLKSIMTQWRISSPSQVISMGGNHSNFLHALSYLCFQWNIPLKVFIRGHQPAQFNRTLTDLIAWQTELEFVSKDRFKALRVSGPDKLIGEGAHWVPEGGSEAQAVLDVMDAVDELKEIPDTILVPVGTGCTALGVAARISELNWPTKVIGVVVLKGAEKLQLSMDELAQQCGLSWPESLKLEHKYCDRGFGKISSQLLEQKHYFESLWQIPLEPVYTVKMCNAFKGFCEGGALENKHVLLWHTGGLQGNSQLG